MTDKKNEDKAVRAAFGAKNRVRLINAYLDTQPPVFPENAWEHVYRMLMWIDQTTGLAHCYESDKCQPGKPWYGKSLAFHAWASARLNTTATELIEQIDWLFKRATLDLAVEAVKRAGALEGRAAIQRKPFEAIKFPKVGEDPELAAIVRDVLGEHLATEPTEDQWRVLVQRIRKYVTSENNRRNLSGRGFEDTLAEIMKRIPGTSSLTVLVRKALRDVPGFANAKQGDKKNEVDMAIVNASAKRTLVTVKWSLRADRERQFPTDFADAVAAETDGKPWEYVFVTNEFDPARLMRACKQLAGNAYLFAHVVHINTAALKATYALPEQEPVAETGKRKRRVKATTDKSRESIEAVLRYIDEGRLISLGEWLAKLAT
jgi:hypothetical protein